MNDNPTEQRQDKECICEFYGGPTEGIVRMNPACQFDHGFERDEHGLMLIDSADYWRVKAVLLEQQLEERTRERDALIGPFPDEHSNWTKDQWKQLAHLARHRAEAAEAARESAGRRLEAAMAALRRIAEMKWQAQYIGIGNCLEECIREARELLEASNQAQRGSDGSPNNLTDAQPRSGDIKKAQAIIEAMLNDPGVQEWCRDMAKR